MSVEDRGPCPHHEDAVSGIGVSPSPLRIVELFPPDIACRQLSSWGWIQADNVRVTRRETFADGFQAQRHLLIAYERAERVDGETLIEGLPKSTLREINRKLGKEVLVTVPVGQAAVALREKIVAGQAPGLKAQWDIFRDNWGHPQAPLRVLDGYCHFAVIYRRSPVGLPVPNDLKPLANISDDERKALNRLLQELAWEAVTHHPLSGVKAG